MKKLFLAVILVLAMTVQAFAASDFGGSVPFNMYSTAGTNYSATYRVTGYRTKTVHADFTTGSASGTLLVQCGPTSSGPWVTCQNEAGTAISTTTSKVMQWSDAVAYVRVSWAKTSGKIKAWLNWVAD